MPEYRTVMMKEGPLKGHPVKLLAHVADLEVQGGFAAEMPAVQPPTAPGENAHAPDPPPAKRKGARGRKGAT